MQADCGLQPERGRHLADDHQLGLRVHLAEDTRPGAEVHDDLDTAVGEDGFAQGRRPPSSSQ